ncbi:MFS transporter [Actinacidiphila bryophytorum]|uniref:MFS transporter n=1 Tax=Actinacidiphila bryophytorum TaxID=1436133 RepID=UPI0020401DEC|nr:MFS transporter [Actinacidiphila bryophytorum]
MILNRHSRRAEQLLVPAAFATALGNNVQLIAGALLVIREQQAMMAVGWLFIAVAGPQALLSPLFGRLADRFDRRALWIGCDVTSAALALGLPLWLACGGSPGPGIYGANLALAVVGALFSPASSALIKERISADRLRRFNARYEMGTQAGMLLSATIGGLCVQAFGAVPLLVFNAGTFVVSALCVAAVGRRPDRAPTATAPGAPTQATTRRPLRMRRFILLYAQGSVVVTVFNALLPTAVIGELHLGAATFGVVDALGCLGFLVATGAYRIVSRRGPDLRIAVVGFLLCSVGLVLQSQFGIVGYLVGVPLGAFFFGQARIASRTMLMTSADDASVGRVFGLANGAGLAATVVVMFLVATVTDHSDTRYGFGILAALALLATLSAGLLLRSPAPAGPDVSAGQAICLPRPGRPGGRAEAVRVLEAAPPGRGTAQSDQ